MCYMCMFMVGNHTSVVDPLHFPERLCNVIMKTNYKAACSRRFLEADRGAAVVCLCFLFAAVEEMERNKWQDEGEKRQRAM